jgi:hypothetical protein
MMAIHPVPCQWTGEAFEPRRGYVNTCNRQFAVGQVYTVQAEEPRSSKSHRRFFAAIHDAWESLPEPLAALYPSSEHFRKRGLIATGYRTVRQVACASKAEATRLALFAQEMDEYSVATVDGAVCTVARAMSQSVRAMGGQQFRESVEAVENWAASLIGATGDALRAHTFGARAA